MLKLKNDIFQELIDDVIEVFKRENEESDKKYDIPFLISILWQEFNNRPEHYKELEEDLKNSCDICINKFSEYPEILIYFWDVQKLSYRIRFETDERYWGDCECNPDMKDYREDKKCCGHGCDWIAPAVTITKCCDIASHHTWNGDEHDYWDFEDMYYKKEKEEATKKLIKTKKREIEYWKDVIKNAENKLEELENSTINGERITSIIDEYDCEENKQCEDEIARLKKKIADSYKK